MFVLQSLLLSALHLSFTLVIFHFLCLEDQLKKSKLFSFIITSILIATIVLKLCRLLAQIYLTGEGEEEKEQKYTFPLRECVTLWNNPKPSEPFSQKSPVVFLATIVRMARVDLQLISKEVQKQAFGQCPSFLILPNQFMGSFGFFFLKRWIANPRLLNANIAFYKHSNRDKEDLIYPTSQPALWH